MEIKQDNENFIVNRNEGGRERYKLDGKPLTGVTTICNEHSKPFLILWAAKEAYLDARGRTPQEIDEIIKNKQYGHLKKGDTAKEKGTYAHDFVERFTQNFIDTKNYIREVIDDEEIANSVYRFYNWAEENKVEFLATEISVYSREHWFAGSFDFICKIDGKTLLGDFKTSKQIDDTYFAQGAAYVIAVEENNPDIKFDGVIIVRSILAKNGATYYKKSSNGKAKKITNEAFEVATSYNLDRDKAYFLSLLNCYRYRMNREIKKWHTVEEVAQYSDEDYPIE